MDENILKHLRAWFKKNAATLPWRPAELDAPRDPYAVWISETMLQQTQVSTVMDYFIRWMKRFPDVETLAKASEEEVFKYWQGLGYYSRARNILKTAKMLYESGAKTEPQNQDRGQTWKVIKILFKSRPFVAVCVASMLFLAAQMFGQSYYTYLFNYYFNAPGLSMLPTAWYKRRLMWQEANIPSSGHLSRTRHPIRSPYLKWKCWKAVSSMPCCRGTLV